MKNLWRVVCTRVTFMVIFRAYVSRLVVGIETTSLNRGKFDGTRRRLVNHRFYPRRSRHRGLHWLG